jgi:hypothetical protein
MTNTALGEILKGRDLCCEKKLVLRGSVIHITHKCMKCVGFKILAVTNVKNTASWVVTTRSSETARRFGGTYHLYLRCQKVGKTKRQDNQAAS